MFMIKANQEILEKFSQLPVAEKKKIVSVILRDALETEPPIEVIPPDFSDEVLVLNAEEIFLELDQIEAEMSNSIRGEVWLVDLGFSAKARPCLVLSIFPGEENRALTTLVPHTTTLQNSRFEIELNLHFLKKGGFNAQNLITIPHAKMIRSLGKLNDVQFAEVERKIRIWLGL